MQKLNELDLLNTLRTKSTQDTETESAEEGEETAAGAAQPGYSGSTVAEAPTGQTQRGDESGTEDITQPQNAAQSVVYHGIQPGENLPEQAETEKQHELSPEMQEYVDTKIEEARDAYGSAPEGDLAVGSNFPPEMDHPEPGSTSMNDINSVIGKILDSMRTQAKANNEDPGKYTLMDAKEYAVRAGYLTYK